MKGNIPIRVIIGDEKLEAVATFSDELIVSQDALTHALEIDHDLMMQKIKQALAVKLREMADKLEAEA